MRKELTRCVGDSKRSFRSLKGDPDWEVLKLYLEPYDYLNSLDKKGYGSAERLLNPKL